MRKINLIFLAAAFVIGAIYMSSSTLPETKEILYTVKPGDSMWSVVDQHVPEGHDVRYYMDLTMKASGKKDPVLHTNEELILVVPKN